MQTQIGTPPDPLNQPVELPIAASPRRVGRYGWPIVLASGPIVLLILQLFPSLDQRMLHNALGHVLITGVASILGVILALLSLHVAQRAQDGRVFLVGMGFLSTASIFITHSISTPDVLMTGRGLATGLSALVSLVLGSVFFALSGLSLASSTNAWLMRKTRIWLAGYLAFWLIYNWAVLIWLPSRAALGVSPDLDLVRKALGIVGLGCFVFALLRHYRLYRGSPSPAGLAITCGITLFGEALLTQSFSQTYSASFWLYHIQEFAGFGIISYAVLGAYRRGQGDEGLLESLFLSGTRARLQASYARAIDSLVETLSRGEQPTAALRDALRVRFGLSESQVQVLEGAAAAVAQERRQRHELEQLNAALRQLEQDKSELTQMIVHDLKNPLTALVGFLEMLRMDHLTDNQRLLLESALRSGKNLSGLIGDLLDVGRIEEGRMELERSLFPACDLLNDCADEMRGWLTQDEKTILVEAPADLLLLHADLRLLRRVLLNLVSNAIKHTPPGTHIELRAYSAPAASPATSDNRWLSTERLVIEVADNGPGIEQENLDRIFDKFGRFSIGLPTRQQNTGLGLTFCRLAVEAHGGSISVVSAVGQGTTFRVEMPGF
jgi:two-component system, OmpR family, sensor kinase